MPMFVLTDFACTVLSALGAALLVRFFLVLGQLGAIERRLSRKLVHITGGLLFMLVWPLYSDAPSAAFLATTAPLLNAARLIATGCGWLHDPELVAAATRSGNRQELRQIRGPLAYVLVLLCIVLCGWRRHPAGIVAAAMMCGGDGLADVAGSRWGKGRPLPWNSSKSWPGSAAMLLGSFVTAVGMLSYFTAMGCMQPLQALGLAATAQRVALIAAACTLVESLPSWWLDDNITVPAAAVALGEAWLPGAWPAAAHMSTLWQAAHAAAVRTAAAQPGLLVGAAANSLVFAVGLPVLRKGLSDQVIAHAWLLGSAVYGAFGAGSYLLMCLYFIIGTLVTRVKLQQKQQEHIAEAHGGRRGVGSEWGSGAAALTCAALAMLTGRPDIWQVGYVASLASNLADTVSSEIGKAYGTSTYLITSLKEVPRGTEGAVSLQGTLAGVIAAAGFSVTAMLAYQEPLVGTALLTTVVAAAANLLESYLGATLQGRFAWMTNDAVNVLHTSAAAAAAVSWQYMLADLAAVP